MAAKNTKRNTRSLLLRTRAARAGNREQLPEGDAATTAPGGELFNTSPVPVRRQAGTNLQALADRLRARLAGAVPAAAAPSFSTEKIDITKPEFRGRQPKGTPQVINRQSRPAQKPEGRPSSALLEFAAASQKEKPVGMAKAAPAPAPAPAKAAAPMPTGTPTPDAALSDGTKFWRDQEDSMAPKFWRTPEAKAAAEAAAAAAPRSRGPSTEATPAAPAKAAAPRPTGTPTPDATLSDGRRFWRDQEDPMGPKFWRTPEAKAAAVAAAARARARAAQSGKQTPAAESTARPTGEMIDITKPEFRGRQPKGTPQVINRRPAEEQLPLASRTGYRVGKGETLADVARQFMTTEDELRKMNAGTGTVSEGQFLKVPFFKNRQEAATALRGVPEKTQSQPEWMKSPELAWGTSRPPAAAVPAAKPTAPTRTEVPRRSSEQAAMQTEADRLRDKLNRPASVTAPAAAKPAPAAAAPAAAAAAPAAAAAKPAPAAPAKPARTGKEINWYNADTKSNELSVPPADLQEIGIRGGAEGGTSIPIYAKVYDSPQQKEAARQREAQRQAQALVAYRARQARISPDARGTGMIRRMRAADTINQARR